MIEIKNLGEVVDEIDKWLVDCEKLTTRVAKGIAVQIFSDVIYRSVQYSGDFAANWKFKVGSIDTTFEVDIFKNKTFYKFGKGETEGKFEATVNVETYGDTSQAPRYAARKNAGRDSSFKLGDTIYLSNSSTHDHAYAPGIETGETYLRNPNNRAPLEKAREAVLGKGSGLALIDASNVKKMSSITQVDSLRRRRTYT